MDLKDDNNENDTRNGTKELQCGTIGIDSGGSLTKIVCFRPHSLQIDLPSYVMRSRDLPEELPGLVPDPSLDLVDKGTLRFLKIPRHKSFDFLNYIKETNLHSQFNLERLNITGGGAFRLANVIKERLQIAVEPLGEIEMLVQGLNYLLQNDLKNEVYTVDPLTKDKRFGVLDMDDHFPYLLVNIGSGVSILKVTSNHSFERVSGSTLGGGTFWALCRLLTNVTTYEQVKHMCARGDSKSVDLLVGDIYGFDSSAPGYNKLGLSPDIIASSLGKIAIEEEISERRPEDIVRSLMFMIANNITQIAYLNARLHNISRIIFAGGFLADNLYLLSRFSYGINFWSGGNFQALFLRHDGFLGALGAMLHKKNDVTTSSKVESDSDAEREEEEKEREEEEEEDTTTTRYVEHKEYLKTATTKDGHTNGIHYHNNTPTTTTTTNSMVSQKPLQSSQHK